MNTPAHAVLNLLILGRKGHTETVFPIVFGAILPDLPMFGFYFYEKFLLGTPESIIWSQRYFDRNWQIFFDLFNSIPLFAIALGISYFGAPRLMLLCASAILHGLEDLPLHNDDAHRHFFPFSNWRFQSPFSYWDSDYYGNIIGSLEAIAVLIICFFLLRRYPSTRSRILIASVIALYIIYGTYAVVVWGG